MFVQALTAILDSMMTQRFNIAIAKFNLKFDGISLVSYAVRRIGSALEFDTSEDTDYKNRYKCIPH